MAIKEGDFIRISFTGKFDDEVFDTTDAEVAKEEGTFDSQKDYAPLTIRVGAGHVLEGLDDALSGMEVGEEGEVEIPPEKGYGPRDESLVRSTSIKNFSEKPQVGTRIQVEGKEGIVTNIVGNRVVLDFNHPLAGRTLHYTFRIEDEVEGTEDQAKALIKLFSGREMDVEIDDGTLTINLPPGISYDRRWQMGRGMAVHQIFEFLDDVETVVQKEIFRRQKTPEAEAGEEPEPVVEAESEPEEASEE
ncbi:MAG: FKBP-type peptidyl-prolyl cis-trans isomerase [Methanomicrobiaceae archaeon]|nr:FKBP-type peptidyl-prolyl cis-trans isomerase [Methanomicrobiaceae archaeon]